MENRLIVSPSPHIRSGVTTASIMRDVCIALVPALIASLVIFGLRSLAVVAVAVAASVLFEYLFNRLMKKEQTIGDFSAVVTGILLAFNLPVTIPLWIVVIGAFVAIVVVKQLFGGIGQNFVNPALTARVVLMISFPTQMTNWVAPFFYRAPDAVTSATVLSSLKAGETANLPSTLDMLLGVHAGCLGETCALALIAGGIYLVVRRVISPVVPVCFVGTVFLLTWMGGREPVTQILSGGLMLAAIFMATDYTTSAITTKGKIVFGIGCGLITCFIRLFGSYAEGVSFAILLMNILCPYVDRFTRRTPFGVRAAAKKGGAKG